MDINLRLKRILNLFNIPLLFFLTICEINILKIKPVFLLKIDWVFIRE